MHVRTRTFTMAALAVAIIAAGAVARPTPAGQRENGTNTATAATQMVGTWELNRNLSEIPAPPRGERPQGSPPDGRGPRGGPPPPGFSGRPEGGPGRRPEGGPDGRLGGRDRMGNARNLTIAISGDNLLITTADGEMRLITPDGQPAERRRGRMIVAETAHWEAGTLVIESVGEHGPKVSETFALATDGRLVHTVTTPRPDSEETSVATHVYDRSTK